MMGLFRLLLLFPAVIFSQPVIITIDNLVATDSTHYRHFKLNFTIANTSNDIVSFFVDPNLFIPAHGGPMTSAVFYKIYQEEQLIEASGILGTRLDDEQPLTPSQRFQHYSQMNVEDIEQLKTAMQQHFLATKMSLKPGEQRQFSKDVYWDYGRYRKQDDNEFYLDPAKPHFVELMLIFWREEYESKLTPEQFANLIDDKTIIKGWFASNKYEIDFSE